MTERIEKTVFISYRRANKPWALFIYQNLTMRGYDVFIDFQNINSGNFETAILDNIKARAHFVVILTPSALENCKNPNDWLRREIEAAMDEKRNIVPLMVEGFDFGSPLIKNTLTGKLAALSDINGLRIPDDYPFEAMDRLRERYLNVALRDVALPTLQETAQEIATAEKSAANDAPPVEKEELTAQTWFERGFVFYESNNYDEAIRCYTEAIRLTPDFAAAYNNRGNIYYLKSDYDRAIKDHTEAIKLDPEYAVAYSNRGAAKLDKGDFNEAMDDLDKAIQIDPTYANAYVNRGAGYHTQGNFDKAIENYSQALQIKPDFGSAYNKRGLAREKTNDIDGAFEDFDHAIKYRYPEEEHFPYYNRGRIRVSGAI